MLPSRQATTDVKQPIIRYVNLTINNPLAVDNKCAEFDTTYDRNILNNAGQNTVAVVNMSLPLQELPLFVFPIEPGQANVNLSPLGVGICKNLTEAQIAAGTSATVTSNITNITWVPQEVGITPTVQTTGAATMKVSPYNYCYSFEHFVNLVNTTVSTAYGNASIGSPGAVVPLFSYNDELSTFQWELDTDFTGNALSSTGWSVCWNEDFDNLVNNFNTVDNTVSYPTDGMYILENVKSQLTNISGNIITLKQDYPTTDAFNTAARIVVLTSSIPIATDYFPSSFGQLQSGGLSNEERILVDLPLDFDNNIGAQRSTFVYQPSLYQLSDLESTLPMRRISVKIKWADSLNNFYDIPLSKGDVVTMKLGFFNKQLNVV